MTQERTEAPRRASYGGGEELLRSLSDARLEIIPIEGAREQAAHLPPGARVTVTCSPSLGIERTLGFSEELADRGLRVVPHVSARLVESRDHLRRILARLDGHGIGEVFVVGGDAKVPAGPFHSAGALLREMSGMEHGVREIGITAYPESHPLIDDEVLVQALLDKQPFATYMSTQICFDPGTILGWLSEARQQGVELPVYIGLPGVVDRRKLLRISLKIGIGDSARFLRKQAGLAGRLIKPGGYSPDRLIQALAPYLGDPYYDIAGFHINTFNQVESTERWRLQKIESLQAAEPRPNRAFRGRLFRRRA